MAEAGRTDPFVPGPRLRCGPTGDGPLNGLSFAAKDLFDVAGDRKTSGNPDWQRTHPPAVRSSPVIVRLLAAGARLEGKTVMDELAYSLQGENAFFGTPLNPRAPDRVPGGSSSGSASAVAHGLVDFALGSDTGGSVRVPASYCGIFGIRPTHGRISLDGMTPLAPSFDTVGWFARDGATLARVGGVLLEEAASPPPDRFLWASDAFDIAEPGTKQELLQRARELFGPMDEVRVYPGAPSDAYDTFRTIGGFETWQVHGPWIAETHPRFAAPIEGQLRAAAGVTAARAQAARDYCAIFRATVRAAVPSRGALVVPASPTPAPPKADPDRERTVRLRETILSLEAVASLSGVPEVVLPVGLVEERPVALGVIGAPGSDSSLLALAASSAVARAVR